MKDPTAVTKKPASLEDLSYTELVMLLRYRMLDGDDREKIVEMIKEMIAQNESQKDR